MLTVTWPQIVFALGISFWVGVACAAIIAQK
jgi:hypothetical protein